MRSRSTPSFEGPASNLSEAGSAPTEFVLLVAPIALLFYAMLSVVLAGLLQTGAVSAASKAAEVCGLRDTQQRDVLAFAEQVAPRYVAVNTVTCVKDGDWAEVTMLANFAYPFNFLETEVTWHAASEVF